MFTLAPPFPPWRGHRHELRIDVKHPPAELEATLEALYERLRRRGDALQAAPDLVSPWPHLLFRCRQADGESYVYVEDIARGRLAGYTVFKRLSELGRQADRHLRAPHSKYHPAYQRRGIASTVYRWALDAGMCLLSGARQSEGAHALWQSLNRRYPHGFVELCDRKKTLRHLGPSVPPEVQGELSTRMLLLGEGWCLDRLAGEAGLLR